MLDIVEIQIEDIHDETVRKVCENFQYLDMDIFVHVLSGSKSMRKIVSIVLVIMSIVMLGVPIGSGWKVQTKAEQQNLQSGIMLDCARTYYTVEEIKKYIDILAKQEHTFLQLHLSDNENVGIECETLGQIVENAVLTETGSYRNQDTQKEFLSYEQIKEILEYAQKNCVTIIPEIDMPGHMTGFFRLAQIYYGEEYLQQIAVNQEEVPGELNITSEEGQLLAQTLLEEYANVFAECPYYHMGCDEYWTNWGERMIAFVNKQAAYLQQCGFTVRIWNDFITNDNIQQWNHDMQIVFWSHDGAASQQSVREERIKVRAGVPALQQEGFQIVMTNSYYLYFVPSARSCTQEALDYTVNDIKNNWTLEKWDANYEGGLTNYDGIVGAMIGVWGEESAGISTDTIRTQAERMYLAMRDKLDVCVDNEPQTTTESKETEELQTTTESKATEELQPTTENQATEEPQPTTENQATEELKPTTESQTTEELKPTTENKATEELQPTTENKATEELQPTTENQATEEPQPTTENQATEAPKPTTESQATEAPKPTTENKTTEAPQTTTEQPKTTQKQIINDSKSNGRYRILSHKKATVAYVGPLSQKKKQISIPATITVEQKTYRVVRICQNACRNNKKITKVTIGKNISQIGKKAFFNCPKLKKITIKTTKLSKKTIGKNAISKIGVNATIRVPKAKRTAYKILFRQKGLEKIVDFR